MNSKNSDLKTKSMILNLITMRNIKKTNKNSNKGFSLIAAVFIIAVLALVVTYVVKVVLLTQSTSVLGIQGTRAYYAAKSGLEWGTQQAVISANCPASTTINFNQGALSGYRATVTCSALAVTEGGNYTLYSISSQGQKGTIATRDYVSRTIVTQVIQ